MPKATNLEEAIVVFDPTEPLKDKALDEFYVDRLSDALGEMETRLRVARKNSQPVKLLLTGQRGCGKSTELNKLAERLRRDYFIVQFEAHRALAIAEVTYVDLILGMAAALFRQATEKDVIAKAPGQILEDVLDDVRLFFERTVFGPDQPYRQADAKLEHSAKVNLLAVEFQTKFAAEGVTREAIRTRVERQLGELLEKINRMADQVALKYKRPVLFIVEGTDKPDLARARDIFFGHGESLVAPRASIVYTFPIELRYSPDFSTIQSHFDDSYFLPNLLLRHIDGRADELGPRQLTETIDRRLDTALITAEAKEALMAASGGLMRILIRLTQRAAVRSLARNRLKISLPEAQAAIEKERGDLIAMLAEKDYETLAARRRDKRLYSGDVATQDLLRALALLEYRNQTVWCDVNPMLVPVLDELKPSLLTSK